MALSAFLHSQKSIYSLSLLLLFDCPYYLPPSSPYSTGINLLPFLILCNMHLNNLLFSTLHSGLKSVVFISVLPVYHWDSCEKKRIALDFDTSPTQSSAALQNFVLRIRMAFDEVKFGKTIRFYSLPKYFTDV